MIISKVRWKNLLSTGDEFSEMDCERSKSTLIYGENGAGKSTFLDALCFGLFSKPFRNINKAKLINSINRKNCLVEVELRIGNTEYLIRRGLNPQVFEVYSNGNLLPQHGSVVDQQQWFENTVIKTSFKTFTQVVVIGSTSFTPFMKLKTHERRAIVEDLLDIKIFSVMNDLLSARRKEVRAKYDSVEDRSFQQEVHVSTLEENFKKLKVVLNDKEQIKNEKLKELHSSLHDLQAKKDNMLKQMEILLGKLDDGWDEDYYQSAKVKVTELGVIAKNVKKELDFLKKNESCPTCHQIILDRDDLIAKTKEKFDKEKAVLDRGIRVFDKLTAARGLRKEVESENQNVKNSYSLVLQSIEHIQSNIESVENEDVSKEEDHSNELQQQIEDSKTILLELLEEKKALRELRDLYEVASKILKDDGIKAKIVKKFVPVINASIGEYLRRLGLNVQFELNEEFDEIIRSRGYDDFSYENFSMGERQRIDLSLLLTWRRIAKLRGSLNCNLLILDETLDASLDKEGIVELISILQDTPNTFIISHRGESLSDVVRNVVEIKKEGNFSVIQ